MLAWLSRHSSMRGRLAILLVAALVMPLAGVGWFGYVSVRSRLEVTENRDHDAVQAESRLTVAVLEPLGAKMVDCSVFMRATGGLLFGSVTVMVNMPGCGICTSPSATGKLKVAVPGWEGALADAAGALRGERYFFDALFDRAGMVWFGGLILGTIGVTLATRIHRIPTAKVAAAVANAAPFERLSYGFYQRFCTELNREAEPPATPMSGLDFDRAGNPNIFGGDIT